MWTLQKLPQVRLLSICSMYLIIFPKSIVDTYTVNIAWSAVTSTFRMTCVQVGCRLASRLAIVCFKKNLIPQATHFDMIYHVQVWFLFLENLSVWMFLVWSKSYEKTFYHITEFWVQVRYTWFHVYKLKLTL
jgi:hypothetical protein